MTKTIPVKIRIKELAKLWCKWNSKIITGDNFAYKVGNIFIKECLKEWHKND